MAEEEEKVAGRREKHKEGRGISPGECLSCPVGSIKLLCRNPE
jgi:hypothetical protein